MGKLGYSSGSSSGLIVYPEKTINITYTAPRETVLETPETLASSEPTTASASFTVLNSDLPTFDMALTSVKYTGTLLVGGKNNSASSKTVNYSVSKNGSVVRTGSTSVPAGYYYCLDSYNFFNINVNDVIEAKVWCDSTVDLRYKAFFIQPTRVQTEGNTKHKLITDLNFTYINNQFSTNNTAPYGIGSCYNSTGNNLYVVRAEDYYSNFNNRGYIPISIHDKTKGLYILDIGDYALGTILTVNSEAIYKCNKCLLPVQIKYKPTNYTFD